MKARTIRVRSDKPSELRRDDGVQIGSNLIMVTTVAVVAIALLVAMAQHALFP